jgi:hypothetical protein
MSFNFGFADSYAQIRVAEFQREADNERLVALASGPARPWRVRVAGWLKTTAEWIDEPVQHGSIAHAEA